MKTIKNIMCLITAIALAGNVHAQSSNTKVEHVRVLGNCEMCKSRIEKSGSKKGEAKVQWDNKSKMATITYDSLKQTDNDILRRIALAGYDNERFLAPDAAYSKLPDCCKYERNLKRDNLMTTTMKTDPEHKENAKEQQQSSFSQLFSNYFELKEALVQSDAKAASGKATNLGKQAESIDMSALTHEQHTTWMKVYQHLNEVSNAISKTDKIDEQRMKFSELSKDFYELAKVARLNYEVYYQHCPMFNNGADWLSKESDIKNPFYGNQMLTCGKTMETIK